MEKNKYSLVLLLFFVVLVFVFLTYDKFSEKKTFVNKTLDDSKSSTPNFDKPYVGVVTKTLFVPYWSLKSQNSINNYDRVVYFGITGTEKGIDFDEVGYKNLQDFASLNLDNSKTYLAIRMTNTEENLKILENKSSMIRIIEQSINIAKQYNFSGIVLDLEVGVLFGDEIIDQISEFSNNFYKKLKENNIKYSIVIYGDVFYRKRPYDLSQLSKNSDEIMIMAYDFHKSISEPGPNFPLNGKEIYGYDFQTMINDYLKFSKPEKITVIFGMYGYDWIVDDQDRPIKPGAVLTLNQIRSKHSNDCNGERCEFVDEVGLRHIIWFENEESVEKKIEYLKSRGIGNFAYWAYGYF